MILLVVSMSTITFLPECYSGENPDTKIVNGWLTDIRDTPYFVQILQAFISYRDPANFTLLDGCGSTIIDVQWIMTAAHCVKSMFFVYDAIYLAIGVNDREDLGNMVRKKNVFPKGLPRADLTICHPEYRLNKTVRRGLDEKIPINDICLVRVDHDLQFGPYINRATLPWTAYEQNIMDEELIVSGFGQTIYDGSSSIVLFSTRVKLLQNEECVRRWHGHFNMTTDICAISAYKATSNPCYGDSGSGMIYKDNITDCHVLIGIVSSGERAVCGIPNKAVRYMSVMAYKEWVEKSIERYSRPRDHKNRLNYNYPARNSV